jgi:hypothetical protein
MQAVGIMVHHSQHSLNYVLNTGMDLRPSQMVALMRFSPNSVASTRLPLGSRIDFEKIFPERSTRINGKKSAI